MSLDINIERLNKKQLSNYANVVYENKFDPAAVYHTTIISFLIR